MERELTNIPNDEQSRDNSPINKLTNFIIQVEERNTKLNWSDFCKQTSKVIPVPIYQYYNSYLNQKIHSILIWLCKFTYIYKMSVCVYASRTCMHARVEISC